MDYQTYTKIKKQIELEYQDNLASLEKIWKLSQQVSPSKNGNGTTNTDLVKNCLSTLGEPFTINEIVNYLDSTNPNHGINRTAISNILTRLEKQGAIRIIERGKGKRPTKYRLPSIEDETEDGLILDEQPPF